MLQCKKILVPLDGSPLSEKALEPALAIAKAMSAELVLLRVTPPVYLVADSIEIERLYAEVEAKAREEAELYLKGLRSQLQNVQVPVQVKTMPGLIAESIIDFTDRNDVDLIVISSHGRSGISRWVYGSVAEKVLRGARCAVLIIRGNQIPLRNVQVPVQIKAMSSPVAESIVDCADHSGVDLIVISSHGRSGISRWVYGSVPD